MKNSKTYLKLLIVVGLVAVVGGSAGTFASFNATTTNENTFATGTLVLSNKVGSAAACLSTGSPTTVDQANSEDCGALFALPLEKPGTTDSADLVLKNEGTLNPSALTLATTCDGTNANAATTPFAGTADLCDAIEIKIVEYQANFTAPLASGSCVYGGASCAFDDTKTLSDLAANAPTFATALDAGTSRYFRISVQFPDTVADQNDLQGRTADVGLTWKIAQ